MKFLFRISFILAILIIDFSILLYFLKPIFVAKSVLIPYAVKSFDICLKYPIEWKYIKVAYVFLFFTSNIIISNAIFSRFFSSISFKKNLNINISNNLHLKLDSNIVISEKGLYQNILITGTIGSGKTSSAIYPFCEQLISYKNNEFEKLGMLILDVKGNFHNQINKLSNTHNRIDDLIIIELGGNVKYNPLHNPNLKASVLANRLKNILLLFSKNNSDSYWLDKAESALCEAIKLCRMYNNGYVTFDEIHKLISYPNYLNEKRIILKEMFQNSKFPPKELFDLSSAIDFFDNEFNCLDSKVLSIIKSEITRITSVFINDLDVFNTFCSDINELTFTSFSDVIKSGKIVVLNMNIAEYSILSKIIATYLKFDFQTEVISSISKGTSKPCAFICDEYHEYVSKIDADFFSQSREAKCINIVSTQSYTSLLNTLGDITSTKVIIQNLVNKLWFRSDDSFTIEEAQKQLGKEDKVKQSNSISENLNTARYNLIFNNLFSDTSSFSESITTYVQNEYIYDTKFFTQELDTFSCLAFLSDGEKTSNFGKIKLNPYFKTTIKGGDK